MSDKEQEYTIESFRSAQDFLERMKSKVFDLLLLDIEMPTGSGLEFAKELRRDNQPVCIVFVSGKTDRIFDTFEASPFAFVRKSKLKEDLDRTLLRYLLKNRMFKQADNIIISKKERRRWLL